MKQFIVKALSALLVAALILGAAVIPNTARADMLGYAATPIESSGARVRNIERAADKLTGATVKNGEVFSFNGVVGARTKADGYDSARNGRGVNVIAGGVGQLASTVYLAAKQLDGVKFISKRTYGARYNDTYVESGDDAIVVDWSEGVDFSFRNGTGRDLVIYAWTDANGGELRVRIETAQPAGVSVSTPITGSSALRNNIQLAADMINETRLTYGQEFSFNAVVGPRTKNRGFKTAVNGRGVDVTGGGTGQAAATLWLAIKQIPAVSVVEKQVYGARYNQGYVESGDDAIVVDYSQPIDFKFRYYGEGVMVINCYIAGDSLICNITFEGAAG